MRGNYELGVVVGVNSRSVLKGVRSSENGVCGFKCTLSGKLLLVGCESGDSTPYLRAQVLPLLPSILGHAVATLVVSLQGCLRILPPPFYGLC